MPLVQIIHNPGAGDQEISKKELVRLVKGAGYSCRYCSTKDDDWKDFELNKPDIVLLAGGDGTVRKGCKVLLDKDYRKRQLPVALIPLGTANNLSKTLKLEMQPADLIAALPTAIIKNFGIGKLENVDDETFFLESFGYGIFPYLMMEMKKRAETRPKDPKDEIKLALRVLHKLLEDYPPRHCNIKIDGVDHSGEYIMAEIMNIKSIGPNLFISPAADPSDDVFEVVMVAADRKKDFSHYIQRTMNGDKVTFEFICFRGKDITMTWEGTHVHVDDKLIKLQENQEVKITIEPSVFRFMTPLLKDDQPIQD